MSAGLLVLGLGAIAVAPMVALVMLLTLDGGGARMIEAIHALLVALPAFAAEPVPESPGSRAERLEPVAMALWDATESTPAGYTRIGYAGASCNWAPARKREQTAWGFAARLGS